MDIQNMLQFNPYQYFNNFSHFGETEKTAAGPEKSAVDNFYGIKASSFQLDVKIFSKENFNDQNEAFNRITEASLSLSVINIEVLSDRSSEIRPKGSAESFFEDGMWGIEQTSKRLADFVIKGAGNDVEKMRQGREGIIRGFKEAEKIWGGKLPEISYNTLDKALDSIDKRLQELGGNIIDIAA